MERADIYAIVLAINILYKTIKIKSIAKWTLKHPPKLGITCLRPIQSSPYCRFGNKAGFIDTALEAKSRISNKQKHSFIFQHAYKYSLKIKPTKWCYQKTLPCLQLHRQTSSKVVETERPLHSLEFSTRADSHECDASVTETKPKSKTFLKLRYNQGLRYKYMAHK